MKRLVLFILVTLASRGQAQDWRADLNERLNCPSLGSQANFIQQGQILSTILGMNTRRALDKLNFKHDLQLSLFANEIEQLNIIKIASRSPPPSKEDLPRLTSQNVIQFMDYEKFLDPRRVCKCAYARVHEETRKRVASNLKVSVEMDSIYSAMANCIAEQFDPTMFDRPELYD